MDPKSRRKLDSGPGLAMQSEHLEVGDAYDIWAKSYDSYDNPMVFAATRALTQTTYGVAGKDCIEFGCGTGRNLAILKQAGAASLTGLDLSQGMLDVARQRDPSWQLAQHDMCAPLPFEAHIADFVLFSLTLEHVSDLATPLREAKRMLRSGGRVRIIEIHPFMSLGGVAAHFSDGDRQITMPTFPHQFDVWINAIKQAGFQIDLLKEWRARDFGEDLPEKLLRRGLDWPWLVDFRLSL